MIYFSIPGFYSHTKINYILFELIENFNSMFYDNIIIDSIFDCFPVCIWAGGRPTQGYIPPGDIKKIINDFNNLKVSIRYTFTNGLIQDKHLYDTYGNFLLDNIKNTPIKSGINISSEILKDYIEKKYPNNFYFNWSATKGISKIEDINNFSKKDLLVPSCEVNNNWEILDKIKNKENIELLVNESCNDFCIFKQKHYNSFNKYNLFESDVAMQCQIPTNGGNYYNLRTKRKHNISIDQIFEEYSPKGFNRFKIGGREESPINLIESYILYFVKKEYKDYIRNEFLNRFLR